MFHRCLLSYSRRLLASFAQRQGSAVDVTYVVSGRGTDGVHVVQLVAAAELEAAKARLQPLIGVHVYCVRVSVNL